jgi:hypothetical protein
MHSKDRYFLGFKDKGIEFIVGLSTTWTFVASCPVFNYTFLYGYTSDSEGNLYLLANYKKGCQGLNDGRLHSVIPHEGAESYYVARIDTSFRLNGEFVIGSSSSTPDAYDY